MHDAYFMDWRSTADTAAMGFFTMEVQKGGLVDSVDSVGSTGGVKPEHARSQVGSQVGSQVDVHRLGGLRSYVGGVSGGLGGPLSTLSRWTRWGRPDPTCEHALLHLTPPVDSVGFQWTRWTRWTRWGSTGGGFFY